MNIIVFYVVAFDPIKIQTSQAPQNVSLNPSFVKDINVVGRNGRKMANSQGCLFFGAIVYTYLCLLVFLVIQITLTDGIFETGVYGVPSKSQNNYLASVGSRKGTPKGVDETAFHALV